MNHMSKENHKNQHTTLLRSLAKKERGAAAPPSAMDLNPPQEAVKPHLPPDQFQHLHSTCPDPREGFQALPDPSVHRLVSLVVKQLQQLQPGLDVSYWKHCTREIMSVDGPTIQIIPARAGYGKSTWILAFLLVMAKLYTSNDPLAHTFGGVLLVLQKVADLNAITERVNQACPSDADMPMLSLQSLTLSGKARGLCCNPQIQDVLDCPGKSCSYADQCPLLLQQEEGDFTYLLGATQARFCRLRQSGALDQLLLRTLPDGSQVHRRLVIFDEKPELFQLFSLDQTDINSLSTRLESLTSGRQISDRHVSSLQKKLRFLVERPFQQLRQSSVLQFPNQPPVDQLAGFATLQERDPVGFAQMQHQMLRYLGSGNRELQGSLPVMAGLHAGETCLFSKICGFQLSTSTDGMACLDQHQVLIFDATAEVDGDYRHHPSLRFLDPAPPRTMDHVVFHIYDHPKLNVSKSAMQKNWLLQGLSDLIEELIRQFPGETFLVTYKEQSLFFAQHLSSGAMKHILLMPDQTSPTVPYFGGTNGSNAFRTCTNVILLGYPRLNPDIYLDHCYAAWQGHGFQEQLESVCSMMIRSQKTWKNALRDVPMLVEYESRHLAARLEQEIFRCALRDPDCTEEIHIFLFAPPAEVWRLLKPRFPGCRVETYTDLPACITAARENTQTYGGKPTAYAKMKDFLDSWDGMPVRSSELRKLLDITPSAWKDLLKLPKFKQMLDAGGVIRTKLGKETVWFRPDAGLPVRRSLSA